MNPLAAVHNLMDLSRQTLQDIHRELTHVNIPDDQADEDERDENAQALSARLRQLLTGLGGSPTVETYSDTLPSIIGCNPCYSVAGETVAEASATTQLANPVVVVLNCEPAGDYSSSASTLSYASASPHSPSPDHIQRTTLEAAEDWRAHVGSELARRGIFLSERSLPAFRLDPLLPPGPVAHGRRTATAQILAGQLRNLLHGYCDPDRTYGVLAAHTSALLRGGDPVLIRLAALGQVPLTDLLLGALILLIETNSPDAFETSSLDAFIEAILSIRQFGITFDPDLNISELTLFLPPKTATSLLLCLPDFPFIPSTLWAAITHSRTPSRRSLLLLHHPFRTHHDRGDFVLLLARSSDLFPDPPTHSKREPFHDRKFRTENFSAKLDALHNRLSPCPLFGLLADPESLPYILLLFPKAAYSMLPPQTSLPLTTFPTPFHSCESHLPSPHPSHITARPRLLSNPKAKDDYDDFPGTRLWELFGSEGDQYLPLSPGLLAAIICPHCLASDFFYRDTSWIHPAHRCPAA
eukprot:tig00020952_g16487.t1